jgi:hypothetical protein
VDLATVRIGLEIGVAPTATDGGAGVTTMGFETDLRTVGFDRAN